MPPLNSPTCDSSKCEKRVQNRLKSINHTKQHACYDKYISLVPKALRRIELNDSWHPSTPDHRLNCSNSQWNHKLSKWRHQIYKWNDVSIEYQSELVEALESSNVQTIIETYNNSIRKIEPKVNPLFEPCQVDEITPVIFKPKWFKGKIIHSGFVTIDEIDFQNDLYNKCYQEPFMKSFYEETLRKYIRDNHVDLKSPLRTPENVNIEMR
ncbi:bifunctional SLBP [Babesia duncani]|uniref:Bifunctional SLBP n=1 Tax=Babesia duncani TaxID=323732 RepID=A0AAD9PPG6_9APIC|nr:bifunctional SLBP [Babesia duncani]